MNWKKINSSQFEKIACSYAEDNYKDFKWLPTQRTRDGNKDGEFSFKIPSLNFVYRGWYEAKYSKDTSSSIPKSHMDSTLVSGILNGEVRFILFITNARIIDDFKRRATAILKHHKINVHFVEKDALEAWLNTMPEICKYYFDCDVSFVRSESQIDIDDCCFINYSLSPSDINSPVSKLSVNNEYFIYLGVKANSKNYVSINIDNDVIMLKETSNNIWELNPGFNSVFIRIIARKAYRGTLKIYLSEDGVEKTSKVLIDFLINDEDIKIVYSQQAKIIQELFHFVQPKSSPNVLLTVSGNSGIGKSYLLRELVYSLVNEYNQCLVLNFTGKEAENACHLCELILFLNFGSLYSLSEEAFTDLVKNSINLPFEIFFDLQNGVFNQISAVTVINRIQNLISQKIYSLIPKNEIIHKKETLYIIIDDVQKISQSHSEILESILDEYCARKHSQVMIIAKRPNEFVCPSLEKRLFFLCSKQWDMTGLQRYDINETFRINFHDTFLKFTHLIPEVVNVFQLIVFIKIIKEKNITNCDTESYVSKIHDCYLQTISQGDKFIKESLEKLEYKNIFFIIYKIESGVNAFLLRSFFGELFELAFTELIEKSIIKEDEKEMLKPIHDSYLYAFNKMKFNKAFYTELHSFLEFCLAQEVVEDFLASKILAILTISEKRKNYKEITERMCTEYYEKSNFAASLVLAKSLVINTLKMNYWEYSYKDLLYLYIYAQSIKFSVSHSDSCQYFDIIYQAGKHIFLSSLEKGIVCDALSELVNNHIWLLNTEKTETYLSLLEKQSKINNCDDISQYSVNGYLNFLNRRMLYASFKNDKKIDEYYNEALEESIKYHREEYVGYAKMDYAKCLYIKNSPLSLDLLENAKRIFVKYNFCQRRLHECEAEICFLKTINNGANYDNLIEIQRIVQNKRYSNSFVKISLKILTLDLLMGVSPESTRTRLHRLIMQFPDINKGHRLSLAMFQFLSLSYYFENDSKRMIHYAKKHISLAKRLSEDYTYIPLHNMTLNKLKNDVFWVSENATNEKVKNVFWIDPRIW